MPGMRPGGGPMPNFFVPMVQQGQQGQRSGGRRAGAIQQTQQPVPMMQQQVGVVFSALFFPFMAMIACSNQVANGICLFT